MRLVLEIQALNELLHLGYVTSELGLAYPQPILLEVDNATATQQCLTFLLSISPGLFRFRAHVGFRGGGPAASCFCSVIGTMSSSC